MSSFITKLNKNLLNICKHIIVKVQQSHFQKELRIESRKKPLVLHLVHIIEMALILRSVHNCLLYNDYSKLTSCIVQRLFHDGLLNIEYSKMGGLLYCGYLRWSLVQRLFHDGFLYSDYSKMASCTAIIPRWPLARRLFQDGLLYNDQRDDHL